MCRRVVTYPQVDFYPRFSKLKASNLVKEDWGLNAPPLLYGGWAFSFFSLSQFQLFAPEMDFSFAAARLQFVLSESSVLGSLPRPERIVTTAYRTAFRESEW